MSCRLESLRDWSSSLFFWERRSLEILFDLPAERDFDAKDFDFFDADLSPELLLRDTREREYFEFCEYRDSRMFERRWLPSIEFVDLRCLFEPDFLPRLAPVAPPERSLTRKAVDELAGSNATVALCLLYYELTRCGCCGRLPPLGPRSPDFDLGCFT